MGLSRHQGGDLRPRWPALLPGLAAIGLLVFAVAVFLSWRIAADVKDIQRTALREFGGDPVHALIRFADSPAYPLRERNRAVWALGQVGDPRALPFLEQRITGEPCDHASALCQREVRKAIHGARGGFNLPSVLRGRRFP